MFVAIYWVNHHHLMQVVHRIDGRTLWANIHLLFWLSLTPIATAWLGEAGVAARAGCRPTRSCCSAARSRTRCSRWLCSRRTSPSSKLAQAIGSDRKGKVSLAAYVVAFACSFVVPWVSVALFVAVAIIWFIPDRRIERVLFDRF